MAGGGGSSGAGAAGAGAAGAGAAGAGAAGAGAVSGFVEGASCTQTGTLRCGTGANGRQHVALYCDAGRYVKEFECPGLQTCQNYQGFSSIGCSGTAYAKSGAPCSTEGSHACSFDQTIVQICDNGEWIDGIHCPPEACRNVPESTDGVCSGHFCSNCGYSVGDVCTFAAGGVVCSTDLRYILQCANGRTVINSTCTPGRCTFVLQGTERVITCSGS
jgi:hypothetical protein